ncbi:dienelactone hydrolase family protein [Streptomyces sp. NPDC050560]|uniref:dienelactone hydrolase family protein n=1 Tax=Streptomyces sp. NPDC050560 TaxID=3365630 RepID=UPI00379D647C
MAAVSHGPAALLGVTLTDGSRLLAGKRVAALTGAEEKAVGLGGAAPFPLVERLVAEGATQVPGPGFAEHTVRDGRLVTGQNPASAAAVARAVVRMLAAGWTEIPTAAADGGTLGAYVARPDGAGPFPGVVVAPELFGVNGHVEDVTRRVAELGCVAIAPDFHHRTEPRAALGYDTAGRERGFALLNALTRDGVTEDVAAALTHLSRREGTTPRTGMVGFSVGGHLAVIAAARLGLDATAAFYPGWLTGTEFPIGRPEPTLGLVGDIRGRLLVLVGEDDHVVPAADRERIAAALAAAGPRHELVVPAGIPHGYFCDERDSYRPEAAADAWRRVARLLDGLRM